MICLFMRLLLSIEMSRKRCQSDSLVITAQQPNSRPTGYAPLYAADPWHIPGNLEISEFIWTPLN